MNNAQFNQHALVYFNGPVPPGGDPDYENGWYNVWLPLYNNSHGDSAVAAMQKIIDIYFPDGCSCTTPPVVTFSSCFDTITTLNAKPIRLKGGIPLGGTYSGPGVDPVTGVFTPLTAGTGTKTHHLYLYQFSPVQCQQDKDHHCSSDPGIHLWKQPDGHKG